MRVIIESPYRSDDPKTFRRNLAYSRKAIFHSLSLGESPFASHRFYTQFLDDNDSELRYVGINCGLDWMEAAQLVAVYADYGVSPGMQAGLTHAAAKRIPVSFRYILGRTKC